MSFTATIKSEISRLEITKEEWIAGKAKSIPRTPYLFWRLVNGKKVYL